MGVVCSAEEKILRSDIDAGGATMKKHIGTVLSVSLLLAIPAFASTVRIYVSNQNSGSIFVVDPATNKIVQTIDGMLEPDGAVFSLDGTRAYIPDQDEHVLNVVDTKSAKSIKKVMLSGMPNLPIITNDGKRIYIAIWATGDPSQNKDLEPGADVRRGAAPPKGAIDIVDTTTLEKIKTLPMKAAMHDMVLTSDGKYLIAGSPKGKFITTIDLKTDEPVWDVTFDPAGLTPSAMAGGVLTLTAERGPGGAPGRIFAELEGLNGFSVVDFEKRKEVSRIQLPIPPKVNYTHGTAISPDGKTLWVCSGGSNYVFIYSLPDLKLQTQVYMPEVDVEGRLGKGADPHWVTFTPDGKKAYIPMAALGVVAVVDAKNYKLVDRIQVGENPRHVSTLVMK
jgi:YVTN family beta-propeller protein